jgi:outer membrane receptor protein involved in Fe transport
MVVLIAASMYAQTFRGTILGTVTDKSGAVIAGAQVNVRNVNTGLSRTTQTTADGSYSVSELPIGSYQVTVTQKGFQTFVADNVPVSVAGERRVDATLAPGQVESQVVVSAEALPQVETTSNTLGGTLTPITIENLPVNGRDYTKLIYLNPGISGSPDQITDSPGSFGLFSMNGNRGRSNNFLLDGTDMNDGYRNLPAINEAGVFGDPATILPVEAVGELRVLSNYESEYGRNSGAVINIVTKSGTNDLHGTALEFFRNQNLGARNFFNFEPNPKNPFHNHQFGGSLGGPIVKNKTFFFLDYEGQRESGAQAGLSCVPDPAVIATIAGPINPVAQALLANWPAPNIPGAASDLAGCTTPNLSTATRFSNRVDSVIAKLDHNINANNLLTGRYYFGDSDQSFPFAQLAAGLLPGFNTVTPTRVQLVSLSYVKVVNTSQVNEARLGWNRYSQGFFPQDRSLDPSSIGLDTGVSSFNFGLPKIVVGNFSVIGATSGVPRQRVDSNWHIVDNYSWKTGRHDLKFGYEFRRTTTGQTFNPNFRGTLKFTDLTTFLAGIPDAGGSQAQGDTLRHTFENSHGLYVQDSFRWTPRLTLNLGMRWDYFGVFGEKDNLLFRFVPTAGGSTVQVGSSGGPGKLYSPDHNNFAPRLAFAYDVTGHGETVIRGGWGIFYDAFSQDMFIGHIPFNCTFCPGPAYPTSGPGAISLGGLAPGAVLGGGPLFSGFGDNSNTDFFAVDPNMRTPYVENFNLNVQQALGRRAVFQIGYVGSKGTKLFRFRDINQPSQAEITAADLSSGTINSFSVPRQFSNFFYVNQEESTASSIYHSLQTSVKVNQWHNLTSQVNFVWGHSIDNASDLEDATPNFSQPNNSLAPQLERGNSNFDVRRRFTWNYVYTFPSRKGSYAKLTDGWGINGALTLQDGQPFHLNQLFEGDFSGSGEGIDRPDVIGPIVHGSLPFNFLDLSSFAVPCTTPTGLDTDCVPGTRHFGNMGRNSLRGPAFKEFNFAIAKITPITERVSLELRAEAFNLFNHPNFANPILPGFIADPGTPGAGGRFSGFLPLTTTGDVGIGNPFLGGGGPRGIQLAAKISF